MPAIKPTEQTALEFEEPWLRNALEVSCFVACFPLINRLREWERAFQAGEISRDDFLHRAQPVLERLVPRVADTEQFDIILPVMGDGRFSPHFWRWFNRWEDYFRGLIGRTAEMARLRKELRSAMHDRHPGADWSNSRPTPAFSLPEPR